MESPESGVAHEDFEAGLIRSWAVGGEALRSIETRGRDDVDPLLRVTTTLSMNPARRMAEGAPSKRVAKSTNRGTIDGYCRDGGARRGDRKGFRSKPLAARGGERPPVRHGLRGREMPGR